MPFLSRRHSLHAKGQCRLVINCGGRVVADSVHSVYDGHLAQLREIQILAGAIEQRTHVMKLKFTHISSYDTMLSELRGVSCVSMFTRTVVYAGLSALEL